MKDETERKLKLMRFLREENRNNRMKMRTREEILYGKSSMPVQFGSLEEGDYMQSYPEEIGRGMSGFGIRVMIAAALFGAVLYMDRTDHSIGFLNAAWVEEKVSASYNGAKWMDFMENFPYTLHIEENQ